MQSPVVVRHFFNGDAGVKERAVHRPCEQFARITEKLVGDEKHPCQCVGKLNRASFAVDSGRCCGLGVEGDNDYESASVNKVVGKPLARLVHLGR